MKIIGITMLLSLLLYKSSAQLAKVYPVKNHQFEIFFSIPTGFHKMHSTGGEGRSDVIEYSYSDSSIIYITDQETASLNYNNVIRQEGSFGRLTSSMIEGDTISFNGRDSTSLFWRIKFLGKDYTVGYLNVKEDRKDIYDQALESLRLVYLNNGKRVEKKNELENKLE